MDDLNKKLKDLENRVKIIEDKLLISLDDDILLKEAKVIVSQYDEVSASMLQRRFSIGYSRAARLLDQLEEKGYVEKLKDLNLEKFSKRL